MQRVQRVEELGWYLSTPEKKLISEPKAAILRKPPPDGAAMGTCISGSRCARSEHPGR